ncbi:MAG: acyl-CoA dehydrogenase family protein [Rhodoferax sp.]|nr:acyl-CoA dehydrogenase family protein [Rhodoferax sp.]
MPFQPHTDDIDFILHEVLQAAQPLQALVPFAEVDDDLMRQVVAQAGKFVAQEIAPLQTIGDAVGCQWQDGKVRTPPGFAQAYRAFWQGGWPALACAVEDGGQGLPTVLEAVLYEMLSGANHGWTMAPGLLHGAYECLKHHGSEALRTRYLEKIATGEWLATMCLTEPHAGSDLGLARTKAVLQGDGSYALSGSKIFISGGEHDLTDNIIHLVLARLPDAPPGPKGLSLFLAPKVLPSGQTNTVHCDRIEEKMGLHGSPTCAMRFDHATAWMIGEPNRGLNAMFVMMNAARLHVGLQGIGLLEAAWQMADAYAQERRQMRAPKAVMGSAPDPIAQHPAMRRILQTQRAWIDAGRVLAYRTAIELDLAQHHATAERRQLAQQWCSFVTPVLKAAWTAQAFHGASDCLQVFGGHGYVREWGIEQIVRDARVSMIYEGTNEIQAIDLLVRKVLPDGGTGWHGLLQTLCDGLDAQQPSHALFITQVDALRQVTQDLVEQAPTHPELAYWLAEDYLRAVAVLLLSWAWLQINTAHLRNGSEGVTPRWSEPAQAVDHWVLPELEMRLQIMRARLGLKVPVAC